jgi:putative ATP-binding cassette transporter
MPPDQEIKPGPKAGAIEPPVFPVPRDDLLTQVVLMTRAMLASQQRNRLILLALGLASVIGATAAGQIELNAWNQPFYDALSRKDLRAFFYQLWIFAVIAGALLVLNVAQAWLNQMTKMTLREALTRHLFDAWLAPRRAFRMTGAGDIGVNPDQRIHEDARHLVELSTDLGIGLFQASLLLASFIGVLWMLSSGVTFHVVGLSFSVPGYMVWCALLYAGTASWLSWLVGRPLIRLNSERYSREAGLRVALVRVNESIDAIAFYGGEQDEKGRLNRELNHVLRIMRRLVSGVTRLTWVTAGYGWFAIVAPVVVAAPGYFSGDLSLGGLMMAVGAFNQVQQALRWFVDNFSSIADWRATLLRVASFRQALVEMDTLGDATTRIELVPHDQPTLELQDVGIASAAGCTRLSESHVVIKPAERILIIGQPGVAKTDFLRAIAGLWPFGCGRILLPPPETMMFVSQRPYVPRGTLRDALAYPAPASSFSESDYCCALERMGLPHLTGSLGHVAQWDRTLTPDEQQSLAFARLLLHKPRFVLIDGAIDALNDESRDIVFDIFRDELVGTAILNIGRPGTQNGFFTRVLHLVKDQQGARVSPCACAKLRAPPAKEKAAAL